METYGKILRGATYEEKNFKNEHAKGSGINFGIDLNCANSSTVTGHGTAIAGIIYDIAPNAEIYSVRIMDSDNKATLSRVVEGIYWCIDNDIDIINMSFGTTVESAVLKKAIQDANEAGILMVSSAGNGDIAGVEYPAAYEEVIAVGSVDTSAQKTEESAVGEEVELVAPGEQILSDSMLGLETVVSGTSMAAPHVTAAAAVLWQKDKTKSSAFIRNLLAQTANELGDAEEYGNGLIDLEYALSRYDEFATNYEEATKQAEEEAEALQTEAVQAQVDQVATEEENVTVVEEQLVQENVSEVETFEEVDYVEGRWGKGHLKLAKNANDQLGSLKLNKIQLNIFKAGAVYPDEVFVNSDESKLDNTDVEEFHYWHGGVGGNYIANYIFATQMAYYAGDKSKYTQVKGHTRTRFNKMSKMVTLEGVMKKNGEIRKWEKVFEKTKLNYKVTENRRKIFLYGMASHIITDAFAHSAYVKVGNEYKRIKHRKKYADDVIGADSIDMCANRFVDAQTAMYRVLCHLQNGTIGEEIDFAPEKKYQKTGRGYYLGNVLYYACKCTTSRSDKELKDIYKKVNYSLK